MEVGSDAFQPGYLLVPISPPSENSAKAFTGGDMSLLLEFYLAVVRATLLEGLVYVVTIGKETDEKIVSMGCWFGHGVMLFKTYAFFPLLAEIQPLLIVSYFSLVF